MSYHFGNRSGRQQPGLAGDLYSAEICVARGVCTRVSGPSSAPVIIGVAGLALLVASLRRRR